MMFAPLQMTGRVVLITGAATSVGRELALILAGAGADICLADIDLAALSPVAVAVEALGVRTLVHLTDLDGAAACRDVVSASMSAFGRMDALCHAASFFAPSHAEKMEEADWDKTLAVNLSAPFFLFQAAVPHLIRARGAIVTLGSCGAFLVPPYTAAYTASKAAIIQLTKVLAKEYSDKPIRINCIAAGSLSVGAYEEANIPGNIDMAQVQKLSRGLITARDAADLMAFLISDAAAAYHGACLTVDNGLSLG
jgi:NAD(P)-dependent dehydrogenase (short-subunit alcohol dehydrogenase family)